MRIDGTDIKAIGDKDGEICVEVAYRTANPYPEKFTPTFHHYRLDDYISKKGRSIFVCSMADLFGSWVPDIWIEEVFKACEKAPQHNYLFLTKNVERYCKYGVPMTDNMWYGTSITREAEMCLFNQLPAFCNTFVSIEPILEDLKPSEHNVMFRQVKWVIQFRCL